MRSQIFLFLKENKKEILLMAFCLCYIISGSMLMIYIKKQGAEPQSVEIQSVEEIVNYKRLCQNLPKIQNGKVILEEGKIYSASAKVEEMENNIISVFHLKNDTFIFANTAGITEIKYTENEQEKTLKIFVTK